ncbi:MAG: HAMP domain-containing protein [Deltaproteobacteria bacterium]|nr:MAG: HAMP domain-containing protein [Deltaproteobacteria bacterium]
MNLQTRVLLGYAYLVLLLLLTAVTANVAFQRISAGLDSILGENVSAVTITMRMLEEIERQDSATLTALLAGTDVHDELRRSDLAVQDLLHQAAELTRIDEETELIARLVDRWTTLRTTRERVLDNAGPIPLATYEEQLSAPLRETRDLLHTLLDAHHLAMLQADDETRVAAQRSSIALGLIVVLALLSMGFLSRALQVEFLQRLAEARDAASAIASGETGRRMPADRNDELGLLARQLNLALDRQQELEQRVRGQLNQQRQILLALVDSRAIGSALLGLDGELIAESCPDRMLNRLSDVATWIREQGRREVMDMDHVDPIERTFAASGRPDLRVTLLIAPPSRPVGWLVESIPRRRPTSATASDLLNRDDDSPT